MIKKIIKNRYINAFLLLLLYSATFHFLVIVFRSFAQRNFYPLNFFGILNLDILFPELFKNTLSGNIASIIVVVVIYYVIFKTQRLSMEKKQGDGR